MERPFFGAAEVGFDAGGERRVEAQAGRNGLGVAGPRKPVPEPLGGFYRDGHGRCASEIGI